MHCSPAGSRHAGPAGRLVQSPSLIFRHRSTAPFSSHAVREQLEMEVVVKKERWLHPFAAVPGPDLAARPLLKTGLWQPTASLNLEELGQECLALPTLTSSV
ncbi:hypothetical protein NDU88_003009 [Pleurodeles waltl]|uniref:Uncharacterized protein n=1 Tax=Pleurodeles waltl TaxID=8319 RepID=A0AAV7W0Y0_PLEWA|nr:hypothetical protein NDU88_003009 [Pleurodeles waltl]